MPLQSRAWLEIDLSALTRNASALQKHSGIPLLPMVKADAYGLGAERVSKALEQLDPWGFGVATVSEGIELRGFGISRPILVFTPLLPDEMRAARDADLTPVLGSFDEIQAWYAHDAPWHLAIDTGMSRAGMSWREITGPPANTLAFKKPPDGVCNHFHSAELDDGSMKVQEQRFAAALGKLGFTPKLIHTDNSAAIVRRGRSSASFNRPGVFLYGVGSGARAALQPDPVVTLAAAVVEIHDLEAGDTVSYDATFRASRKSRIATIAAGYADGYPRALSNAGFASVRGRMAPIAGVVTMDMTMLDVTDLPCEVGNTAILIGKDGSNLITVESVASAGGISPYELLTGLRSRVARRYRGAAE